MIGKINYKAGSLVQLDTFSSLPTVGSEATTYYVKDENSFYVYINGKYKRLKTRPTTWHITDTTTFLSDIAGTEKSILVSKLVNMENDNTAVLDIGDMVYDTAGASGFVTEYTTGMLDVKVKTLQANEPRKQVYPDDSWEMWQSKENGGGHYFWDSNTNILTYDGPNVDPTSPIIWESYSVLGGASNFVITGGTKIGERIILAWDGGAPGVGTIRKYYTKAKNNDKYTPNDEIATINDVQAMITSEAGIYVGYSNTVTTLNANKINGIPTGHQLSNNDWAYVLHYDDPVLQYKQGNNYKVSDIIEYGEALYKVKTAFTATNWSSDFSKTVAWDGNVCSYIYRDGTGWTKGLIVDTDNIEPDNVKLTTTFANKMTIKDGGVDSAAIANNAVITSKINNGAITTDKIGDKQVTRNKLSQELQNVINHGDTMWYSGNLIVSTTQPPTPTDGSYILWVNSNPDSI